jgi:cell division protein FtsB
LLFAVSGDADVLWFSYLQKHTSKRTRTKGERHLMARNRSNIYAPFGDDELPVDYWSPETPEFLEKRDERVMTERSSALSYTQAKSKLRRVSAHNRALPPIRREQPASIIDFEEIGRARRDDAWEGEWEDSWEWPQDVEPEGGRIEKLRRDARRRKADREFSRAYADDPASDEDAPRAALYRTKMGRQHQRAARMQAGNAGFASRFLAGLRGIVSSFSLGGLVMRPWFTRSVLVLGCVVLIACSVFPAARNYYVQMRSNDQLAAEYQAVLKRNGDLERHVEALKTDEGMAELAHENLGWVREGDNSVSVLADGSSDPGSGSISKYDAVAEGSIPAPVTWYSPILDVVFGYKR